MRPRLLDTVEYIKNSVPMSALQGPVGHLLYSTERVEVERFQKTGGSFLRPLPGDHTEPRGCSPFLPPSFPEAFYREADDDVASLVSSTSARHLPFGHRTGQRSPPRVLPSFLDLKSLLRCTQYSKPQKMHVHADITRIYNASLRISTFFYRYNHCT